MNYVPKPIAGKELIEFQSMLGPMARMRRSKQEGRMPPTGAGLMRFFDEEARGIKLSPQVIVAACIVIAFLISLLHVFEPAG